MTNSTPVFATLADVFAILIGVFTMLIGWLASQQLDNVTDRPSVAEVFETEPRPQTVLSCPDDMVDISLWTQEKEQWEEERRSQTDQIERLKQSKEGQKTVIASLKGDVSDLQDALEETNNHLTEMTDTATTLQTVVQERDAMISQLKAGEPLDLILVIDATYSMEEGIWHTLQTVKFLCGLLPRISTDVRISIASYRETLVDHIPFIQLKPKEEDGGQSMKEITDFIRSVEPVNGAANVADALARGARGLSRSGTRRSILVLIGDTGPFELQTVQSGKERITAAEQEVADLTVRTIAAWANEPGTDRRIVSFFVRSDGAARLGLESESMNWFRRLSTVNAQSHFCTTSNRFLEAMLASVFDIRKEEP